MTLERRIDILTTVIKTKERVVQSYKNPSGSAMSKEVADDKELLQLLQELQRWRMLKSSVVPLYRDGLPDEYNRGVNDMWEEIMERIEEIADEADSN